MKCQKKIVCFLFSFNRGASLVFALRSMRENLSGLEIIVLDDESTDPFTTSLYSLLPNDVRIVSKSTEVASSEKLGGLYANMNFALEYCSDRGIDYAIFLQDDIQVLRPLLAEDMTSIDDFFDKNPQSYQLQPCFLKAKNRQRDANNLEVDETGVAYFRKRPVGDLMTSFSAVGIFDVARTLQYLGSFRQTEWENEVAARALGCRLGLMTCPLAMWMPFPRSHRGKRRGLLHRAVEWLGRSGIYPISCMSDRDIRRMFKRDTELEYPYAEDFLNCEGVPRHVWSTGGGIKNAQQIGLIPYGLAKVVHKASRMSWFRSAR